MQLPAKQVGKVIAAWIRISAFTANGASDTVTTPITSALSTAGNNGVAVPLQVSSGVLVIGVITTTGKNLASVYDATTKEKIDDGDGNEVYARVTEAAGVYTLTYYSMVDGTETAYSFSGDTVIDFEFSYRFDFDRLPADAITAMPSRNVSEDVSGSRPPVIMVEQITVTGANTLADLSQTPSTASKVILHVNGQAIDAFGGGSAAFSTSGVAITWSAANAGFALATTDRVIAEYPYNA